MKHQPLNGLTFWRNEVKTSLNLINIDKPPEKELLENDASRTVPFI